MDLTEYIDDLLDDGGLDYDTLTESVGNEIDKERVDEISLESMFEYFGKFDGYYAGSVFDHVMPLARLSLIDTVSLYKIDDEFDIIPEITIPASKISHSQDLFEKLVETGRIGKCMQTMKHVDIDPRSGFKERGMIAPLPAVGKIWGLLILLFGSEVTEKDISAFTRFLELYLPLIASRLNSHSLREQLNHLQKEQEQIISLKTLEVNNSRREINAIINTVQAGIILAQKSDLRVIKVNPFAEDMLGAWDPEKTALYLNDIIPDYSISFAPIRDKFRSAGGRNIPIHRTSNIIKLGDKEIIVETYTDLTFVEDIRKEHQVEITALESRYNERVLELTESLSKKTAPAKTDLSEIGSEYFGEGSLSLLRLFKNLNHHLRSPLASIQLYQEILFNYFTMLSEEQKADYKKKIYRSLDYISNILNGLDQTEINNEHRTFDSTIYFIFTQIQFKNFERPIDIQIGKTPSSIFLGNTSSLIKILNHIVKWLSDHRFEKVVLSANESEPESNGVEGYEIRVEVSSDLSDLKDTIGLVESGKVNETEQYDLSLAYQLSAANNSEIRYFSDGNDTGFQVTVPKLQKA